MRNALRSLSASATIAFMALAPKLAAAQDAAGTCKLNGNVVPCEQLTSALGWSLGVAVIFGVLGLVTMVFWIMMIVHAATHPIENKVMWIVIMAFTGIIGALVYYFMVKRKMTSTMPPTSMPPTPPATPPMTPPMSPPQV